MAEIGGVRSMDDETIKSWKDFVAATRKGEGLPTFDEVCQKAALTYEQVALLSTFNLDTKLIIRVRYSQLCFQDSNGTSCLRRIAEDLEILHGEVVSGAKTRFVEKLFGAHALPQFNETQRGWRMRPGSDELWSTCYELSLIVEFVHAGYLVELEPELSNGKLPDFFVKGANIYVEAKRLDDDRQMDIIFGDDPWVKPIDDDAKAVVFNQEKELALKRMISRNVENASAKFDGVSVPHTIFILSPMPPTGLGNAFPAAIEEFLSVTHPGLLGVAIDSREGREVWETTPEGPSMTAYPVNCLPPVFLFSNSN